MARRIASFSVLAVAFMGGCAASRVGQYPRSEALSERPAATPAVAAIVERHNKNAALVERVAAEPDVTGRFGRLGAGLKGNLAFERSHNFRLIVKSGFGKEVADFGSNDDEFWFWGNDKSDRNVYVCRYDSGGSVNGQELAFQPDWIIEAMGLREIPGAEQAAIQRTAIASKPTLERWVHRRTTLSGQPITKVSIVDKTTGQIREHQFFAPGSQKPVAIASPTAFASYPLADNPKQTAVLPSKIHLWVAPPDAKGSPVEMDLSLAKMTVNSPIAERSRELGLFSVPEIPGTEIVRDDSPAPPSSRAQTRSSLPAPPAGNLDVQLGSPEPAPIGTDGASLRRRDPMPLEADLPGSDPIDRGIGAIVNAPSPAPPEPVLPRLTRGNLPHE